MGEVREALQYVQEDLEALGEEAELLTHCDDTIMVNHFATVIHLRQLQLNADVKALVEQVARSISPF